MDNNPANDNEPKRRRIIVEDEEDDDGEVAEMGTGIMGDVVPVGDDEDEIDHNPDEDLGDNVSEDDGEDLAENWMTDYAPAPELDYYDPSLLTEEVVVESYEKQMQDRRAADEALDAEDEKRRRYEEEAEDDLEDANEREAAELRAFDDDSEDEDDDEEDDVEGPAEGALNLEAFDCPLKDWLNDERARREIKRRFRKFLLNYYPGYVEVTRYEKQHGTEVGLPPDLRKLPPIYPSKISAMCASNKASLEVSYRHLADMQSLLAVWLSDLPQKMLDIFDEVLLDVVLRNFPSYNQIATGTRVRITNLPLADKLRDLRQADLGSLIRVTGVVTRITGVLPLMSKTAYDCRHCGATAGVFVCESLGMPASRPHTCLACEELKGFSINERKSEYVDYQRLTLQESPGSVPAGRVPRNKDVVLQGDLIDMARPGEELDVIGIFNSIQQQFKKDSNGAPTFSTVIEANCVIKKDSMNTGLLAEDKQLIAKLSKDPQIRERIIASIAPSIYGHKHIKTAVALSLFGGCAKNGSSGGTHRVRGDINILLLGDPGTAKSQILKYSEKIAPRSVYTTGKGASAVGLTAGVRRDPNTKEWTLEGGALVLADQGVCLIDEFDKMSEQDRTSIHEAMEQQTISVSKAGIVASLQARCAVFAAANPIGGRYDPTLPLAENINLTDPILQRFDVLCVLQDVVDPVMDEQLALFVVDSHIRSHPHYEEDRAGADENGDAATDGDDDDNDEASNGSGTQGQTRGSKNKDMRKDRGMQAAGGLQLLDQDTLKKYITYARATVTPALHDVDSEKIAALYAELRQQCAISGGVPIAVRHIESVVRMAEASARMHLRDHVREDDVDLAIKVMLESFLQAQKISVKKTLQRSFRKYIAFGEEVNQILMHHLTSLVKREEQFKLVAAKRNFNAAYTEVPLNDLENKAKDLNIFDLKPFYQSAVFKKRGFHVDERKQVVVKTY